MSAAPFVSPLTRFGAYEPNAAKRPVRLRNARDMNLWPGPVRRDGDAHACMPPVDTLIRVVELLRRSRSNTSCAPFVSPGTRLLASERNATRLPSPLMEPRYVSWFASSPADDTLARMVVPATQSRTKTSG